jgi:hypothetical protein
VDGFIPMDCEGFRRISLSKLRAEKCFKQKLRSVGNIIADYLCDEHFLRKLANSASALCKMWIMLDPEI